MANKITLSELKRLVKKVVNEDFEFKFDDESEERFRNSEDLGGEKFMTCSNGFEWRRNVNPYTASKALNMALTRPKNILCVLMDEDKPVAAAEIDNDYVIHEVKGAHNQKIGTGELYDCVLELGEYLGREKAMLILRKGGNMGFMNESTTRKRKLQKEGFYFPVSNEVYENLKKCMEEVLYPHGSEMPLTKEQYMDTVSNLAEGIYNEMTGDHLKNRF